MAEKYPVIFVGAGPGDPELITVKGQKALARADLVLYAGSLVSPAVLGWTNPAADLIDTAKLNLEEICSRLMAGQRNGMRVVRVHSGDPALFGAIQEQLEILERENIPCLVIPGVSAAFAAAAALAQELTLPEVTQTVILTRAAGAPRCRTGRPSMIWPGMGPPWSSISASNLSIPWWPNSPRPTARRPRWWWLTG